MKEKAKDILGTILFWLVIVGVCAIWFIGIRGQVVRARNCNSHVSIIDRETRSVAERPPLVYLEAENRWFPAGSVLTSKENGELILATPNTPQDLIVGIVTKSGLITNNYQRTFYNEPQPKTTTGL